MDLVSMRCGGRDRPYYLRVPAVLVEPAPVVVELHGRGIDPRRFDALTGFSALADEVGFVLALPAAVGEIWNDGRDPLRVECPDDVAYLGAVIDDVCSRGRVDGGRVYLVGMSNGAAMAGRFALECADRIAGIGQVAGTAAASVAASTRPSRPVAVIQIHGSGDEVAPYPGGTRRKSPCSSADPAVVRAEHRCRRLGAIVGRGSQRRGSARTDRGSS